MRGGKENEAIGQIGARGGKIETRVKAEPERLPCVVAHIFKTNKIIIYAKIITKRYYNMSSEYP